MSDYAIKQNDVGTTISAVLSDENGVVDLSSATQVRLLLVGSTTGTAVSCVCSVSGDPADGTVVYTWQAGDLAVADVYDAEYEVTLSGTTVATFPSAGYAQIRVYDDLG